ncbi:hypothetical protein [Nonomuraea sp. NPDC050540]|uniref:hypothetical protein n=1 Tax=Nonomuraea sp. NPDC050540 TaxID=3364367 RepID=UPI003794B2F1
MSADPNIVLYQGKPRRLWHGRIVLNWTKQRERWNGGRVRPCRYCLQPCHLLDDDDRPVHKVCLELAITAALLAERGKEAA